MYLENIFIGSEDIRKQLPQESQMFDGVHANFMRQMKSLHATGNCLKACTAQGLLESFQVRVLPAACPCHKSLSHHSPSFAIVWKGALTQYGNAVCDLNQVSLPIAVHRT